MSSSSTQSIPFFQYHHHRPQYQSAEQSPTISTSKMLLTKELSSCDRVRSNTLDFLSAPKRKRDDGIDAISASRRDNGDDDFVYPLHKRSVSATRLRGSSFCLSSYDSERRDGPEQDSDDETEALVMNFRTSVFRQEPAAPALPLLSSTPLYKEDDDDEEDEDDFFPSIGRATTISDASDSSTSDSCYADPPDMADPSFSPREEIDQDDHHHDWSSSSLYLQSREKDPIEEARERPEWLSTGISSPSSSTTVAPSQPSPLWNMSTSKKGESFWPANWTGMMFHQGSA